MSDEFTQKILVTPQYDHRDGPGNRGAHGCELVLILRGPLGAIAARLMTGWMSKPLTGHFRPGGPNQRALHVGVDRLLADGYLSGAYVGAHSYERRWAYMDETHSCDWLDGASCYGDGSYTAADEVLSILVAKGSDAAFDHLATLYQAWIVDRPIEGDRS